MENNRKLRVKFNLFDVVIIVVVLAVLAGALMLRNRGAGGAVGTGSASSGRETHTMRYTVEFLGAPKGMASSIRIGDGAYRSTDGMYLGTIVDVSRVPHEEMEYYAPAEAYVAYRAEEWDDVYLTVENEGYCTGKDIMIGTLSVKVGAQLTVKGKGFARGGYVYAIDTMGVEVPEDTAVQPGELEAEFVICFPECREFIADNIHVGDRFYDGNLNTLIGEVQSVEQVPCGETQPTADGTVYALKPGRSNVLVTLKGNYIERDDGYYLGGTAELKIGSTPKVNSNYIDRDGLYYELLSIGK